MPVLTGGRAKAARALPVALRTQPRRSLRADAAARRRPKAALEGAVGAGHRRALDDGSRAGDHRSARRWRRWPSFRSGPQGAWGGDLGALRDRRPDRAAVVLRLRLAGLLRASCSAGGRRDPSTRSSARCAPPPSWSRTRWRIGMSLLGVAMTAGSLSLVDIVEAQGSGEKGIWFIVPQFVGFLIFLVAGFAEFRARPLRSSRVRRRAGVRLQHRVRRDALGHVPAGRVHRDHHHLAASPSACFLGGWHGPGPMALAPLWMLLKIFVFIFAVHLGPRPRCRACATTS